MRRPSKRLHLSFLVLAAACGGPDASADDSALATLLPVHTVAYLRVASLDAMIAPAREVATATGEDATQLEAKRMLAQLRGLAGDPQWIDQSRPFAIALSAPKATPPTPVFFVPATDPAKYAASLQASGQTPVVHGSYVVLPIGGKYEKPSAPNKIADGLPAGIVSMRVDVEKLAANLGVPIDAGLAAFKAMMTGAMKDAGTGMDGQALAETYVNAVRAVLASTSTLDVRADFREGRLQFAASLTAKAGSDMDGWSSPPVDLSTLDGRLSGKGSLEVVTVADWVKLWPRVEPLMSGLFEAYPAPVRDAMRALMTEYKKVYEVIGPVIAGEGDLFGESGLHLVMHVAPTDGKAFLSMLEAILSRPELGQVGAKITSAGSADADGATVRDYLLKLDLEKMLGAQAGDAAAQKQVNEIFQAMLGRDGLPMRIAVKGGRAVMTAGKPREDVASSFATTHGSWSPATRAALKLVGDCNPMLVERFDMAAMMGGVTSIMAAGGTKPMPKLPAGSSADFVVSAGIRDREWRFGLAIDVVGVSKMMKAIMPR